MVNPLWLEKSYIIENKATDYEKDEDVDSFAVRNTNITAIRYKTFVGSYPTKTTYFQPLLDALEVTFSPLVRSSNAIVVEGKNDYHPLRYFCKSVLKSTQVEIFPGNGAEHSSCLIALFRGWGIKFKVILDDDTAGKKAKDRYIKEMLVTSDEVFTLGEIDAKLSRKVFEDLYQEDVIDSVRIAFGVSTPSKRHFSLFFQELLATNSSMVFQKTEENLGPITDWIVEEFAQPREKTD